MSNSKCESEFRQIMRGGLLRNQEVPSIYSGTNTSHPAFVSSSLREPVPALILLAHSTTLETPAGRQLCARVIFRYCLCGKNG